MPEDLASRPAPLDDLLQRHFEVVDGCLRIGGISARDLAAKFGSPLFVYDLAILRRQLQALRDVLPKQFHLSFSVKANPNLSILKAFVAEGLGLEIASAGEMFLALAAGCPPGAILFAGPGKTHEELALAVSHGIGEIHVESLAEARRLAPVASKAGRRVRIALRVNPAAAVEGGGMRMGARAVPFGMDEDQLESAVAAVLEEPALELVGLHLFVGTQILDHEVLLRQYEEGLKIARALSHRIGCPLETIDLGGGLGVPYFSHEPRLDLAALGQGLAALMEVAQRDPMLAHARFVLEPGRFLIAEAGVYIARVTEIKRSRGKTFVITDGGMHHHLAASGNLGQSIKRNFPLAALGRLDETPEMVADVVGPLCTPLDTIGRSVKLPDLDADDLIGVFQSGAYGLSASPGGFLSRPTPAEILVDAGVASIVRPAGRPEDYARDAGPTSAADHVA